MADKPSTYRLSADLSTDVANVHRIAAVPTILDVVCRTTGMRFAAVARVTKERWVACSVLDNIAFGLKPGGELKVESTICHEIRQSRQPVIIDHVGEDAQWCGHPTPALYGFQSYISMPIILADGSFFGTLCAIDPRPARLRTPEVTGTFRLFAELIAQHLDAQKKLGETESALELARNAMESNPDCVKVLDVDGRVLSVNRNGCALMETDGSLLAGRPWLDLWESPEKNKAAAALASAVGGKVSRFNAYCKTARGNLKYWEVTVSPIKGSGGAPTSLLSISRDMTMRHVEEEQFREIAKLESLGVLAGGIAHDFNNLLTGILGNASLLQIYANPEDAILAGDIVKAAERAADLTRQMLAYAGKGRFLVKRLNLSTAVVEILSLIKTTIDKKTDIILSLDEHLPMIEADPGQMQQLIMNLIINASEAMEGREGKVTVSTARVDVDSTLIAQTFRSDEPSLAVGSYVKLEIHDTGSGMSEETLSKIFDPFFTTKFTGRGLGLAAVSGILRGHRGAIRVCTHLGQGTRFEVFLPAANDRPQATTETVASAPLNIQGWEGFS